MEIFPDRKDLPLVVGECSSLLGDKIDLHEAIATICETDGTGTVMTIQMLYITSVHAYVG